MKDIIENDDMQPEIKYIRKLINIRLAINKVGGNKKVGVMKDVYFLKRHIEANGYNLPEQSRGFFNRYIARVRYIIPGGKIKLEEEFMKLQESND